MQRPKVLYRVCRSGNVVQTLYHVNPLAIHDRIVTAGIFAMLAIFLGTFVAGFYRSTLGSQSSFPDKVTVKGAALNSILPHVIIPTRPTLASLSWPPYLVRRLCHRPLDRGLYQPPYNLVVLYFPRAPFP